TTQRILLGLLRADSGSLSLFGGDPWRDCVALHRRLAYVPGEVTLWPSLSGGETIDVLGRLRGGYRPERRDELVARFDLDPLKKVSSYSKGNRQKVALIGALACDVDLYLFDEPTDGLDPLMAEVFRECVRELNTQGRTVVLSSHILAEVDAVCDRVSIIRSGRIVETGELSTLRHLARSVVVATVDGPVDVTGMTGVRDVTVSGARFEATVEADSVPALIDRLASAGIASLEIRTPTLEEMFMRYYDRADQ
ncbi:MAG: ABC transporter ATP-binding protein, partial [bacterium]|nr:ABC transporter ATP-binding protein [bacterium]